MISRFVEGNRVIYYEVVVVRKDFWFRFWFLIVWFIGVERFVVLNKDVSLVCLGFCDFFGFSIGGC